jgi:hypothetical protein
VLPLGKYLADDLVLVLTLITSFCVSLLCFIYITKATRWVAFVFHHKHSFAEFKKRVKKINSNTPQVYKKRVKKHTRGFATQFNFLLLFSI